MNFSYETYGNSVNDHGMHMVDRFYSVELEELLRQNVHNHHNRSPILASMLDFE